MLLLLFPLLASCVSFRDEDVQRWEQHTKLRPLDLNGLAGRYLNSSIEGGPGYLWDFLTRNDVSSNAGDLVELTPIAPDQLRLSLIRGSRVLATTEVTFEPYPTHIRFGETNTTGLVPVFWMIGGFMAGIGQMPGDDLAIAHSAVGAAMLGPFPVMVGGGGMLMVSYARVR